MEIIESVACEATYHEHMKDRSKFQVEFCRLLSAEPAFEGEKLDIGCGPGFPIALESIRSMLGVVDGVDPFPEVQDHPGLRKRWHGAFEDVDIPSDAYMLAYAYNVVEHIEDADRFFATLRRVLKPGGAFWALTPHGRHPFCKCVKLVQALKLKDTAAKHGEGVNDYPAYYNLNRVESIADAAGKAGFSKLEMVYMPCMQWDNYFPKPMRFVPHIYDRLRGLKKMKSALVVAYRLE